VLEICMASIIQIQDGVAVKKFPIDKPLLRIGRDSANDIFIDDKVISLEHAVVEIVVDPDHKGGKEYFIKDLESTNGTHVNGEEITRQRLNNNDLIRVGWNTFKFVSEDERKPEKTLKIHKSWIPRLYYTKE
jgi:pSer/pThr/pTyr-binding forkhead associated (FHA) protein